MFQHGHFFAAFIVIFSFTNITYAQELSTDSEIYSLVPNESVGSDVGGRENLQSLEQLNERLRQLEEIAFSNKLQEKRIEDEEASLLV